MVESSSPRHNKGSERERLRAHHEALRARRSGGWGEGHWEAEDEQFELLERAVGLYCDDGLSLKAVGVEVGRSKWWVEQRFAELGVRVRPAQERPPTDPAVLAEIAGLYGDGLVLTQIAERVGRSTKWVRQRLDEAGVERKSRAAPPLDELLRLYCDEYWSAKDIAKRFDRSPRSVKARLREAGVEIRHGKQSPPTDPAILKRIVAMYQDDGFGYSRIGREMGRGSQWVKSRLVEAGVELPTRDPAPGVEVDELVRLYVEEELTMKAIARLVGRSDAWVRSRLVAAGVQIRRQQRPTREQERAIVELYTGTDDVSIAQVAARIGVSKSHTQRVLTSAGLIESKSSQIDVAKIHDLYESTVLTVPEIAKQLGYPTAEVESFIRREGRGRRDSGNRLEISARQLLIHIEAGLAIETIAVHYRVTAEAVNELIERHRTTPL